MTQKIQCRSLKLITNNYHSDYYKFPLNETGNSTMEMKRHDIFAHSQNTSNYGDKILRSLEPHT